VQDEKLSANTLNSHTTQFVETVNISDSDVEGSKIEKQTALHHSFITCASEPLSDDAEANWQPTKIS